MNNRSWVAGIIATVILSAVSLGAWYAWRQQRPEHCELSGRVIHENMRTIVRIDGKTIHACCPRCPITAARQTNAKVEFVRVTDYVSSQPLDPAEAYYVSESRITVCRAPRIKLDEARTPYVQLFDRCGPSLLAFAREDEARAFMAENGGNLKRLPDLMREMAAGSNESPTELKKAK